MHAYVVVVVDCERLFLPHFASMYPNYDRSFNDASPLRFNIAVTLLWNSAANGMQRTLIMICTGGTSKDPDLVSNGLKIHHLLSGAMNAVSAVGATVATVARLHLVAVGVATGNALVAPAGVAVIETGMVVVGTKEMAERSAGGEAEPLLPGTTGGACPLIGGEMIEPELLLWMMA